MWTSLSPTNSTDTEQLTRMERTKEMILIVVLNKTKIYRNLVQNNNNK
jgi:hypothetical protein